MSYINIKAGRKWVVFKAFIWCNVILNIQIKRRSLLFLIAL